MGTLVYGAGDQAAFTADYSNEANGLILSRRNAKSGGAGARESAKMDFSHADRADAAEAERDPVAGCDGRMRRFRFS